MPASQIGAEQHAAILFKLQAEGEVSTTGSTCRLHRHISPKAVRHKSVSQGIRRTCAEEEVYLVTLLNLAANNSLKPVAQPCLLYLTLHHIPTVKLENVAQGIYGDRGGQRQP